MPGACTKAARPERIFSWNMGAAARLYSLALIAPTDCCEWSVGLRPQVTILPRKQQCALVTTNESFSLCPSQTDRQFRSGNAC
jgi:hypothetical protein